MTCTNKSAQCDEKHINLGTSTSRYLPHNKQNSITNHRSSPDQVTPRRWPLMNSTTYSYTLFLTAVQNNPIHRDDILRGVTTRTHAKCLNA